jgi:hypothetical protein
MTGSKDTEVKCGNKSLLEIWPTFCRYIWRDASLYVKSEKCNRQMDLWQSIRTIQGKGTRRQDLTKWSSVKKSLN